MERNILYVKILWQNENGLCNMLQTQEKPFMNGWCKFNHREWKQKLSSINFEGPREKKGQHKNYKITLTFFPSFQFKQRNVSEWSKYLFIIK